MIGGKAMINEKHMTWKGVLKDSWLAEKKSWKTAEREGGVGSGGERERERQRERE